MQPSRFGRARRGEAKEDVPRVTIPATNWRTAGQAGRALQERIEKSFFERIPRYALFRSLTQRLAGKDEENVWKPALAEIEAALVPAFIIEEVADGRFTVFVPSIPTPFAGAVYILTPDRVHPLDIPFTQALQSVSRWGSGSKDLVAAMKTESALKQEQNWAHVASIEATKGGHK